MRPLRLLLSLLFFVVVVVYLRATRGGEVVNTVATHKLEGCGFDPGPCCVEFPTVPSLSKNTHLAEAKWGPVVSRVRPCLRPVTTGKTGSHRTPRVREEAGIEHRMGRWVDGCLPRERALCRYSNICVTSVTLLNLFDLL